MFIQREQQLKSTSQYNGECFFSLHNRMLQELITIYNTDIL